MCRALIASKEEPGAGDCRSGLASCRRKGASRLGPGGVSRHRKDRILTSFRQRDLSATPTGGNGRVIIVGIASRAELQCCGVPPYDPVAMGLGCHPDLL